MHCRILLIIIIFFSNKETWTKEYIRVCVSSDGSMWVMVFITDPVREMLVLLGKCGSCKGNMGPDDLLMVEMGP